MLAAAATAGASQPAIAAVLGLGAAGLAGAVVAMAWSVHARQIRLAELLVRRQFILTRPAGDPRPPGPRSWSSRARKPWSSASRSVTASGRPPSGRR